MTKKVIFSAVMLTAMGFLANAKTQHEIRVTTSCGKVVYINPNRYYNTQDMLNDVWNRIEHEECKEHNNRSELDRDREYERYNSGDVMMPTPPGALS